MRAFIRLVVEYLAFLRATGKDEPVDFKMESVGSITVKKGE